MWKVCKYHGKIVEHDEADCRLNPKSPGHDPGYAKKVRDALAAAGRKAKEVAGKGKLIAGAASVDHRTCYNCKTQGHIATDCPKPKQKVDGSTAGKSKDTAGTTAVEEDSANLAFIDPFDDLFDTRYTVTHRANLAIMLQPGTAPTIHKKPLLELKQFEHNHSLSDWYDSENWFDGERESFLDDPFAVLTDESCRDSDSGDDNCPDYLQSSADSPWYADDAGWMTADQHEAMCVAAVRHQYRTVRLWFDLGRNARQRQRMRTDSPAMYSYLMGRNQCLDAIEPWFELRRE